MVIATSDSTNTLVSLDHVVKRVASLESLRVDVDPADISLRPTELFLPAEEDLVFDDDESQIVYLPATRTSFISADECLQCLPSLVEAGEELLAQPVVQYGQQTSRGVWYVAQGEMADSTANVLVSDRATTCHILAVRSCSSSTTAPLGTMTHLDGTSYEDCLRDMMQRHEEHHSKHTNNDSFPATQIQMELSIIGGFRDNKGSSAEITNWLLHLLADLATEYKGRIHMTLRHCLVSSLNDCQQQRPLARGLAMNVTTGHVFLAHCSATSIPSLAWRAARLWSSPSRLALLLKDKNQMLPGFSLPHVSLATLRSLLRLPDECLLECCSTSPDCEEQDFCDNLRQTLLLIQSKLRADGTAIFEPLYI